MPSFEDFMSLFEEYALLVVVCVPVLAIAGLDLFLALKGERGTLLLPVPMRFPVVEPARCAESVSSAAGDAANRVAANDEHGGWREVA